jgi:hypothetical protein
MIDQVGVKRNENKSRVLEILEKLKKQEYVDRRNSFSRLLKVEKRNLEPARTIQQHKVQYLIEKINEIEKKIRDDTGDYFRLYFELNSLEKKFLKAVDELKRYRIKIPELLENEIEKKYYKITKKFGQAHKV